MWSQSPNNFSNFMTPTGRPSKRLATAKLSAGLQAAPPPAHHQKTCQNPNNKRHDARTNSMFSHEEAANLADMPNVQEKKTGPLDREGKEG
jgi:hypothetical protein